MAKSKNSKKETSKNKIDKQQQRKAITGLLFVVIAILLGIAFISFMFSWQADQSVLSEFADRNAQPKNILNKIGAYFGNLFIYKGFGIASFIPVWLLGLLGVKLLLSLNIRVIQKSFWGVLWMLFISISLGFFSSEATILSGRVGYEMNSFLRDYIGKLGLGFLASSQAISPRVFTLVIYSSFLSVSNNNPF